MSVLYPATLPHPTGMEIQTADRRAAEGLAGGNAPASVRPMQRDHAAAVQLSFVLDAAAYSAWRAWWELALGYGGAWFSAPAWVFPWGVGGVVRFNGPPQAQHLGKGLRAVQVPAEICGASGVPADTDHPLPMTVVPIEEADLEAYGPQILAMRGTVYELADEWYRVNADATALELLGGPADLGVLLDPLRATLPTGPIQFRGATDAAGTLGRLGIVINGDTNTAAAARLQAGTPDRRSLITGASSSGLVHLLPWPEAIELVHLGQIEMAGTYTVVDTGPCSAASVQFARLTFSEGDAVRALLVEEYPPTDYAGAAGTGSARLVRVRGVSGVAQ